MNDERIVTGVARGSEGFMWLRVTDAQGLVFLSPEERLQLAEELLEGLHYRVFPTIPGVQLGGPAGSTSVYVDKTKC